MTNKTEQKNSPASDLQDEEPISVDSDLREGNDIAVLVGSGAPMVKVRANAGVFGYSAGDVWTQVQTEELRLNVQMGNLEILETTDA